jgi:hypothetical protein
MTEYEKSSGGLGDGDSNDGSSNSDGIDYFSSSGVASSDGDSAGMGPSSASPEEPPPSSDGGGGDPPPNPGYTMTLWDEFGRVDSWYHAAFELVNTGNVDIIITNWAYVFDSTGLNGLSSSLILPFTLHVGFTEYFDLYAINDDDIITLTDNYGINPTHPA